MEMYGNNWRAAQAQGGGGEGGGAAARAIDSGDWRTQLMPDSRQRIINKIMETLKMHLPVSGQEVEQELKKVAVRLEEKIYSAATSQQDYLQKISLKMLTMETKSQNPMTNSIQPNPASSGQNALGSEMEIDGNNWRAAQAQGGGGEGGGAASGAMDSGDWRTQLMPDSRQRIINKIMETIKRYLPVPGQEGVHELKKIAVRLEEKIYSAATSRQDYLRKISLQMLSMETKSQNPMTNSIQPNPASSGQNALGSEMEIDGNNWRAAQAQGGSGEGGGAAVGAMDSGDWRTQLMPDSRQRIVNKMMETIKRYFSVTGQEGVQELKKIAVRFEEKIYSAATSQQDYLRTISLKMLTMETKQEQNTYAHQPSTMDFDGQDIASEFDRLLRLID